MPILSAETSKYPPDLWEQSRQADVGRRWWAVYTKARQEKAFARALRSMELPFYLPLIPKGNLIRGRRKTSYIPLFTGYVFLFGSEAERLKGLTTNRVSHIIPVADQGNLIHDLERVEQLIALDKPLTVEARLVPGDPVRIKSGPMQGAEGVVLKRRGRSRLFVAVQFLQQGVSVEIDDYQVESSG